ncbi:MAG: YceD family protein [Bacteroidota bacterium]
MTDRLNKYSIPFAGLAEGSHRFEYEIDDSFFELFDHSVVHHAKVRVELDFIKSATVLTLVFHIRGHITMNCDRCLDDFDMPVDFRQTLVVRFGDQAREESDDVIVIPHGELVLDVSQHIYDYISLQVPMRAVHPEDENGVSGCDPEVIRKLNEESQAPEESSDPRWEALKKFRET